MNRIISEIDKAIVGALTGPLATEIAPPHEFVFAIVSIAMQFAKISRINAADVLTIFLVQAEPDQTRAIERLLRTYSKNMQVNADKAAQTARDVCAASGRGAL